MSTETLRAIIIDDERHCIETLRYELTLHCPEVAVIESHQETLAGIRAINNLQPDIVFLDIELDNVTGFQLIETLSYRDFHLIFTTAYDQYTIEALRIKAHDYLMKPISGENLRACLDRLKTDIQIGNNVSHIKPTSHTSGGSKKIILPVGKSTIFISLEHIIRIQADGNFSIVYLQNDQEHYISKSLKEIESIVEKSHFIRIHKSHIININKINAHHKSEGGSIEMSSGIHLPLTMATISEIMEKIKQMN